MLTEAKCVIVRRRYDYRVARLGHARDDRLHKRTSAVDDGDLVLMTGERGHCTWHVSE